MPNHVTNKIALSGNQALIDKALNEIKYDGKETGTIDFNKIIPMPESLLLTCGSIESNAIKAYLTAASPYTEDFGIPKLKFEEYTKLLSKLNKIKIYGQYKNITAEQIQSFNKDPEAVKHGGIINLGKKYTDNCVNYGHTGWYTWATANWDTKWNSYDEQPIEENTVAFNTAWSPPEAVINKLSRMYPELSFNHKWADEDVGSNVGEREYVNGESVYENIPLRHSKEAYEMAAEIIGYDLADWGLEYNEKTQNYDFREEQELSLS